MNYFKKNRLLIYFPIFLGIAVWLFFNGFSGVCSVEPVKSIVSPSGSYQVDVQYRSCGGKRGGLEVLLRAAGTQNQESEVLWQSRDDGAVREGVMERKVSVVWDSDETLRLSIPGEVHKERMALGEVKVKYVGY